MFPRVPNLTHTPKLTQSKLKFGTRGKISGLSKNALRLPPIKWVSKVVLPFILTHVTCEVSIPYGYTLMIFFQTLPHEVFLHDMMLALAGNL